MPTPADDRPAVAVGHVSMTVGDLEAANRYFVDFGMRPIALNDSVAVLELRGGTHLVLRRADGSLAPGREASFDIMVDDIDAAHGECAARELDPSEIRRGAHSRRLHGHRPRRRRSEGHCKRSVRPWRVSSV